MSSPRVASDLAVPKRTIRLLGRLGLCLQSALFADLIFVCIAHLLYVSFAPLGDLLGNIGEELKIKKLPAKVPGVIAIYF